MLWGGVFWPFPKLKFAITEGTCAWVPDFVERLRFFYAESRESQKLGDFRGHLAESPVDTFNKNVMIGASCMSRREAEMRHEIGIGNLMWGSDYPALRLLMPEADWAKAIVEPAEVAQEKGISFSEEEVAAIMGDNAARLLSL